ncbi:hypothetical protein IE81DRAFT_350373 [Ceraceosorus guamensis]|uniref:HBS1-like protein N-terminal domain-containing protein n=1 Tax=Ceraceosorus guamensis TaxID=1522189 RepID=A0A316VNR8_9BASI|nr:hypothetical protein IE81DRAFT_350373 [Ceraceosorus guamensis]PWN39217.1 hypothetical protein IE81DRAFT_350373 [Ceraceosorus guamensis]
MSRHRAVRNLDLDEELADDYYDDEQEPWADASSSDLESLQVAFAQVAAVVAPGSSSLIDEADIKSSLWENYFDVQATVEWALRESKRRQARENKKVDDPLRDEMNLESSSSSSSSTMRPSAHPSGAIRGRGIGGLGTRGRSGMAKRALRDLAPVGLPGVSSQSCDAKTDLAQQLEAQLSVADASQSQGGAGSKLAQLAVARRNKRPAAATVDASGSSDGHSAAGAAAANAHAHGPAADTARPSKLAALAAARATKPSAAAATVLPPRESAPASAAATPAPMTAKPLSKLQQRAQASREAKAAARSGQGEIEAVVVESEEVQAARRRELEQSQKLPSGVRSSQLFPMQEDLEARQSKEDANGQSLSSAFASLMVGGKHAKSAPSVSPFEPLQTSSERASQLRNTAFAKLSPDDVVLQARQGSALDPTAHAGNR